MSGEMTRSAEGIVQMMEVGDRIEARPVSTLLILHKTGRFTIKLEPEIITESVRNETEVDRLFGDNIDSIVGSDTESRFLSMT